MMIRIPASLLAVVGFLLMVAAGVGWHYSGASALAQSHACDGYPSKQVRDCRTLLEVRDAFDNGRSVLNWPAGSSLRGWDGVTFDTDRESVTYGRVTVLELWTEGQDNVISPLTGEISPQIGKLSSLARLVLPGHQLTGRIPGGSLADLQNLSYLDLSDNELQGPIPSELGNLSKLKFLDLNGNRLTGSIPEGMIQSSNLTYLKLQGNSLTGCVPWGLSGPLFIVESDLEFCVWNVPPEFSAPQFTCWMDEGAPVGTELACEPRVQAFDANGHKLTYIISGGNVVGYLAVDADTGVISVSKEGHGQLEAGESVLRLGVRDGKDGVGFPDEEWDSFVDLRVLVNKVILNHPPEFNVPVFTCRVPEQSLVGVQLSCDPPVEAADADGDVLVYALSSQGIGKHLDMDPVTGAIAVSEYGSGRLNHETREGEFSLDIRVRDGLDSEARSDPKWDDIATLRLLVDDVADESPWLRESDSRRYERIHVSWTTSLAEAERYRVQYRAAGTGDWRDLDLTWPGVLLGGFLYWHAVIDGLYGHTEYEIRWRVGDAGPWRPGINTVATRAKRNAPAEILFIRSSISVVENAGPDAWVGQVYFDDGNYRSGSGFVRYWLEGVGSELFSLRSVRHGLVQIRARESFDYESGDSNVYTLTFHVSDGRDEHGARDESSDDSAVFTVTVTDVIERPGSPVLRAVSVESRQVGLEWDTPANSEPLGYYQVQYREGDGGGWKNSPSRIRVNSAVIGGLSPGTDYEFRALVVPSLYEGRPVGWSDLETAPVLSLTTAD